MPGIVKGEKASAFRVTAPVTRSVWSSRLACRAIASVAMPHLETEMKLDFKDVLIRPKRSALSSRAQVKGLIETSSAIGVHREGVHLPELEAGSDHRARRWQRSQLLRDKPTILHKNDVTYNSE